MQGAWVQSLVRELDPKCHNEDRRSSVPQLRPSTAKKKKKIGVRVETVALMELDISYLYLCFSDLCFYLPLRDIPKTEHDKERQEANMMNPLRDKVKHGK